MADEAKGQLVVACQDGVIQGGEAEGQVERRLGKAPDSGQDRTGPVGGQFPVKGDGGKNQEAGGQERGRLIHRAMPVPGPLRGRYPALSHSLTHPGKVKDPSQPRIPGTCDVFKRRLS